MDVRFSEQGKSDRPKSGGRKVTEHSGKQRMPCLAAHFPYSSLAQADPRPRSHDIALPRNDGKKNYIPRNLFGLRLLVIVY